MVIETVNLVIDTDDTVALFEINKTTDNQNEPYEVVMNYAGNPQLTKVHQWLTENNQDIPAYMQLTYLEKGEPYMAMLPIKDLGSVGVITDVAPYNLPLNAYSTGINVRFDEGKVSRSPIFRNIKDNLGYSPRFAYGIVPNNNFDSALVVSDAWYIGEYSNGIINNRSGSITGASDPRPYTGTSLANVTYINRPDRVPVYRGHRLWYQPSLTLLTGTATWSCRGVA